ncbi:glycosyltransferase [Candidatus Saccharibacteria bacterium]|nr:glycosyltransferase [Candidatus Saccharibacteria bacterium]
MSTTRVLEINNIDIYGRRFNGYSLMEYINAHPETNLHADFIVNHKLGTDHRVTPLFKNSALETYDWQLDEIESHLNIKNQISISEDALVSHPLYRKADILHFHMYHNSHFPIEFLTRIPPEKKIIIDIHDTFWLTDNNIPMLEVFKFADGPNKTALDSERRRVLNSIDAEFVVHSPYIMDLFKKSSITKNLNVRLINFGIRTDIYKPIKNTTSLRKKYHIPAENLVLMCRSQKEFKGIDYIISAIKLLHLSQPITLITVGVKGLCAELTNYCSVIDFGNINSEHQLTELYNIADIFLAPSTEESFGFMAAEAMSCGKPVIVFEGTALPNTVNAPKVGLATKKSPAALARAITTLAKSPNERLARGEKARAYVLKHYTETRYFSDYIQLMQSLAKIKSRHVTSPSSAPPPKNLSNLSKFLSSSLEKSEHFDYNNIRVQESIKKYNSNLYKQLLKQGSQPTPKNIIKKIIPNNIKLKLRTLKEKIK